MSTAAHRVTVLEAIANDARAPDGERAAARKALEIYRLQAVGGPCGGPSRHGDHAALALPGAPALDVSWERVRVLLVYFDGRWTLSVDDAVRGQWAGGCTTERRTPYDSFYDGTDYLGSHYARPDDYTITMEIEAGPDAFDMFASMRALHYVVQVVIDTGPTVWYFDTVVLEAEGHYSWSADSTAYAFRSHPWYSEQTVTARFYAMPRDWSARVASQLALPTAR